MATTGLDDSSSNLNNNDDDDVYMTRHSARADRDNYNWKPLQGRSRDDTELSKGGKQASEELAKRFESIPLSHIVSSPFYRCLQTVAPIAKEKNIPIKVEPGICEVLSTFPPGFWDTDTIINSKNNEEEVTIPIDQNYQPVLPREQLSREFGDGQAADRARKVAEKIRQNLDGPILFCGHGASCLGIAKAFGTSGYVGYSSFSHFQPQPNNNGRGTWQTLAFGDVSHLSDQLRQQSLNSAW